MGFSIFVEYRKSFERRTLYDTKLPNLYVGRIIMHRVGGNEQMFIYLNGEREDIEENMSISKLLIPIGGNSWLS